MRDAMYMYLISHTNRKRYILCLTVVEYLRRRELASLDPKNKK